MSKVPTELCVITLCIKNCVHHREPHFFYYIYIGSTEKNSKYRINFSTLYYELWGFCTHFLVYMDTYFLYYNAMPQYSVQWGIKEFPVMC